jgi:hypothetical protein
MSIRLVHSVRIVTAATAVAVLGAGAVVSTSRTLQEAEYDTLWMQSMIGRHRGAVAIAEAELDNGVNVAAVRSGSSPNKHRHDVAGRERSDDQGGGRIDGIHTRILAAKGQLRQTTAAH